MTRVEQIFDLDDRLHCNETDNDKDVDYEEFDATDKCSISGPDQVAACTSCL
jgi:hypothetical protein